MKVYQNGAVKNVYPQNYDKPVKPDNSLVVATSPGGVPRYVHSDEDLGGGDVVEMIPVASKG